MSDNAKAMKEQAAAILAQISKEKTEHNARVLEEREMQQARKELEKALKKKAAWDAKKDKLARNNEMASPDYESDADVYR
jgi:hypothetical protein